jgi:exodeoxyribonuclease V beta subunit
LCNIFVRLVAEKGLPIERILVVTFTRAAARELSERLREGLVRALEVFEGKADNDPFFQTLAARNPKTGALFLRHALKRFDQACIFTIHGFCQRILSRYAFETQTPFDLELHADAGPFYSRTAQDFWRIHFYQAPRQLVSHVIKKKLLPKHYENLLNQWSKHSGIAVKTGETSPEIPDSSAFETLAAQVRREWPDVRDDVVKILGHEGLFDSVYKSTAKPEGNGKSARETRLLQLQAEMDTWADPGTPVLPVFGDFNLLTLSKIQGSIYKKNNKGFTCGHLERFFALCQDCLDRYNELVRGMDLYLAHLDCGIFDFAAQNLEKSKRRAGALFYNDFITLVKKALEGPHAGVLEREMDQAYRAALIDEFQDTDSAQYAIFKKVFARPGKALYLIGDPKQAIYGFRGADLFSYLAAASQADGRHTLNENWRSTPELIKGVNSVFGNTAKPFVLDDILFHPASPAPKKQPSLVLPGNGKGSLAIWYIPPKENDGAYSFVSKTDFWPQLYHAIAARASQLLAWGRQGKALVGDEPLAEKHMAVLTYSNEQALLVQESLRRAGIHSVLYNGDHIFDSPQAMQMLRLLEALARPRDIGAVRGALATPFLGYSAKKIADLEENPDAWEALQARFAKGHERWRELGFLPMLFAFFREEAVFERLLAGPDGARALTNVLHLAELVFAAEKESRLGISALLKHLDRALQKGSPRDEENQLRLESDALAMQVITMHRSKGLQFPVVFCPFLFGRSATQRQSTFCYHDPENNGRLTMSLADPSGKARALSNYEDLAEKVRLAYVALTRARNYCAFAWGPLNDMPNSPLTYLIDGAPQAVEPEEIADDLAAQTKALDPAEGFRKALDDLAERSDNAISIEDMPSEIMPVAPETPFAHETMSCRTFGGRVDSSYRISSFSGLVSKVSRTKVSDWDEPGEPAAETAFEPDEPDIEKPLDIFAFPRGPLAGTMLHALFEETDFTQTDFNSIKKTASHTLARFGFEQVWAAPLAQMFLNVAACPLDPANPDLALNKIPCSNRLDEMEFFLPAKKFSGKDLSLALKDLGKIPGMQKAPADLAALGLAPVRGFIRGFVDCVFCHQGRYYLVDYKSNHLGDSVEDYKAKALALAMTGHHYYLQYHLYALALSRHLAGVLPGYDYETHFGGVFYLFLRGMDAAKGPEYGVFRDRPPKQRIVEMEKRLCP